MELLNSIVNLLSQGWSYYLGAMLNFSTAYPVLALCTFLTIGIGIICRIVQNFKVDKPKRNIFDIKTRIENPTWYTKGILYILERGVFVILEFLVLTIINAVLGLCTLGLKVYFHFQIKRAELPND